MTRDQEYRLSFLLGEITAFSSSRSEITEREDASHRALIDITLGRKPTTMDSEVIVGKLLHFSEYAKGYFEDIECGLFQLKREIEADKKKRTE